MPRVLLINEIPFCEKHQEFYEKYYDAGNVPFWICLECDIEEEKKSMGGLK